ncbi:MAG: DUF167 domain-containing protein, partial [Phycisphaerae bacterium]
PSVTIAGYKTKTFATTPVSFSFYFLDADEKPLSNTIGQTIGDRTVLLPEMQVLQRQDAWSSVLLKRNEFLGGKAIADAFVYTTPDVKFAAPYHPVVGSSQPVQIAELGSPDGKPVKRSLKDQLTAIFAALLKNYVADTITVQMDCNYGYSINSALSLVSLPVLMQPPEGGKANRAVEELLAGLLGVAKGNVTVVAGQTRPLKTVRVAGVSAEAVAAKIGAALG